MRERERTVWEFDAYDWGRVSVSGVANLLTFGLLTVLAAWLLSHTRLTRGKLLIAALFLGHVAANLLRMGSDEDQWSRFGYGLSRIAGTPPVAWRWWRLPGRWRAHRGLAPDGRPPAAPRPKRPPRTTNQNDHETDEVARATGSAASGGSGIRPKGIPEP